LDEEYAAAAKEVVVAKVSDSFTNKHIRPKKKKKTKTNLGGVSLNFNKYSISICKKKIASLFMGHKS